MTIEKQVSLAIASLGRDAPLGGSVSVVAPYPESTSLNGSRQSSRGGLSTSGDRKGSKPLTTLVLNPDDPKTNPWTVMDTLKAIEAEESLLSDKVTLHANRASMAKTLKQQMSIEDVRLQARKAEDDDYLHQQQRMLNEWKREQHFADQIINSKNEQMRKIRQEQIDEKMARKSKEVEDRRLMEAKTIKQVKAELQKEKDNALEKKEDERKRLEKIKIENLKREEMMERRKLADAEEEMRLAREYIARADKEQAAREKALEDRMSRYDSIGQQWAESGAGKKQKEASLALERKIVREAQAKEQADLDRELSDLENLRINKKMMMMTNTEMAANKLRREKEMADKEHIYATRFRREGEAFGAEEELRKAKEKEKAVKHCELLKKQMIEQRIMQKRVDMNETEMSLNKDQMDKILKDPITGAKLMRKLNEKHVMSKSVAFKYKSNVPGLSHSD